MYSIILTCILARKGSKAVRASVGDTVSLLVEGDDNKAYPKDFVLTGVDHGKKEYAWATFIVDPSRIIRPHDNSTYVCP